MAETAKEFVFTVHPSADASWVVSGGCKIYYLLGQCSIALSASKPTIQEAWEDAAKRIKERQVIEAQRPGGIREHLHDMLG